MAYNTFRQLDLVMKVAVGVSARRCGIVCALDSAPARADAVYLIEPSREPRCRTHSAGHPDAPRPAGIQAAGEHAAEVGMKRAAHVALLARARDSVGGCGRPRDSRIPAPISSWRGLVVAVAGTVALAGCGRTVRTSDRRPTNRASRNDEDCQPGYT